MRVAPDAANEPGRAFAPSGYHKASLTARLAASALALACATDLGAPIGRIPETVDPQEARACYERPATQQYLDGVHRKVLEAWSLPRVEADQEVVLAFRLGAIGDLVELRVVRYSDATFARSAIVAMRSAQPFSEPPGEASCLLRMPVIVTLSGPRAPQ